MRYDSFLGSCLLEVDVCGIEDAQEADRLLASYREQARSLGPLRQIAVDQKVALENITEGRSRHLRI